MATTLNNLRENISDAINASKDGNRQLSYDTVIDIMTIEALVAVAEQLRMANLISISNKIAYNGDLALHREIDDYVRRECGDWEDDDDEEGDDDDS